MADTTVVAIVAPIAGLAGVALGGLLQRGQQQRSAEAVRRQNAEDRLWNARREAYAAFIVAFNNAAHEAGKLAPRAGRTVPSGDEARMVADYYFDTTVTPSVRVLDLVASDEVRARARAAADALRLFRDRMQDPHLPAPEYQSDEYLGAYRPAREARERFIAAAASELAGGRDVDLLEL